MGPSSAGELSLCPWRATGPRASISLTGRQCCRSHFGPRELAIEARCVPRENCRHLPGFGHECNHGDQGELSGR
eukprot:11214442-Lingulodinium_polyedra.AAC.1